MPTTSSPAPDKLRPLLQPIDARPLKAFRQVFGLLMFVEMMVALLLKPQAFFPQPYLLHYPFFEMLSPLPPLGMAGLYLSLAISAALLSFGYFPRWASLIFCLGYTYIFLLDQSEYNNHYYLISLLAFLFIGLAPSHNTQTIPKWQLWAFRTQISLVYFFGGLAKLNPDWLQGEPLRGELIQRPLGVLAPLMQSEFFVYLLSYGGITLDLLSGFILWYTPALPFILGLLCLFHGFNTLFFSIGIFPFLMLGSCLLFLPPHLFNPWKPAPTDLTLQSSTPKLKLLLLMLYILLQVLLPLRHYWIPGNVSWTEEGHHFAWHMKLRAKQGWLKYQIVTTTGLSQTVDPRLLFSPRQYQCLSTQPYQIWRVAHLIARQYAAQGQPLQAVYALSRARLNHHRPQTLIKPQINLLQVEYMFFHHNPWIQHFNAINRPANS